MRKPRPDSDPRRRCCLASDSPEHLDVSRCTKHRRIELWVNHIPYTLTEDQAVLLGQALVSAAVGRPGSPEPAEDLP